VFFRDCSTLTSTICRAVMSSTLACKYPANSAGCHTGSCAIQTRTCRHCIKAMLIPKLHNNIQSCSKFYSRDAAERKGLIYIYTNGKYKINNHNITATSGVAIFTKIILYNISRFVSQVKFSLNSQNLKCGRK
jgi:hypothetical protein